jgi:hypothetical protein
MQIVVDQIVKENITIKEFHYLEAQLVYYVLGVVAGEEPAGNFRDYLEHADVPAKSGANISGGCLLSRDFQVCCLERKLLHFNVRQCLHEKLSGYEVIIHSLNFSNQGTPDFLLRKTLEALPAECPYFLGIGHLKGLKCRIDKYPADLHY